MDALNMMLAVDVAPSGESLLILGAVVIAVLAGFLILLSAMIVAIIFIVKRVRNKNATELSKNQPGGPPGYQPYNQAGGPNNYPPYNQPGGPTGRPPS